ncbi:hypothetical protein Pan181_32280 [Aeoliella mucimassa]|uniref:Uncharacterized protein n=1 Tax=Aeoliella mucimassa TaxID=2527972 RepID=A0A518AQL5_9BACT|nr:hypothetical protein Pan181_32280 [Aeoliella mucimassa]
MSEKKYKIADGPLLVRPQTLIRHSVLTNRFQSAPPSGAILTQERQFICEQLY